MVVMQKSLNLFPTREDSIYLQALSVFRGAQEWLTDSRTGRLS
jgi:hypothetical protein